MSFPGGASLLAWWFLLALIVASAQSATRTGSGDVTLDGERHVVRVTDKAGRELVIPVPEGLWSLKNEEEQIKGAIEAYYFIASSVEDAEEDDDERDRDEYMRVMEAQNYWTPQERLHLERIVLAQFFEAVGGTESLETTGFWNNDNESYCDWKGISCTAIGPEKDGFWVVEEIVLPHEELEGTLPTQLALLDHLTTLTLTGNKIWGSIPTEYLSMSSLTTVELSQNWLSGTLPSALDGTATSSPLETMDLSVNRLTGPLPSNWPTAWTGLRSLDLSRNGLSGSIPFREMSRALSKLGFLWLGCNLLDGTLAAERDNYVSWKRSLRLLDLGSNLISGTIPTGLSALSLEALVLANNDLHGSFPEELFKMSSLWTLQLQNNALSGNIPLGEDGGFVLGWSNLSNLGSLFLRYNEFTGPIPSSLYLGLQYNLRHLDLSHNKLTGKVATEIGMMQRLHTVAATSNQIRGSLPNEMLDLDPNLRLNFTDNLITGTIPSMFCGYGAANMLYREFGCDAVLCRPGTFSAHGHATLHSACRPCPDSPEGEAKNPPESTILGRISCGDVEFVHGDLNADGILSPREILRMVYVDNLGSFWGATFQPWADLRVGECDLAGITCNDMGEIHTIDLSTANLCSDGDRRPGPIEFCFGLPGEIGQISSLEVLKMENRQFLRGSIPSEIGMLSRLQLLDMSGCSSMSGTIPSELGNLSNLKYLHMSHGRFRGPVPTELFQITGLSKLHLTNNLFSGTLSTSIGNLSNLKELMISRNKFEGSLPTEMGGLVQLENFEGYYNSFEGSLPSELGNCRELKRIDIFNNKFSGTLPDELASVSVLQILHVKLNELSGTVPAKFGELSFLSWFDISNNKMHGTIPASFASSQSIRDFRLGANMIYDPIPAGLCANRNINGGVTAEYGCDGVLCSLGSYSDVGHAIDDVGCTKCPEGETTLYLGASACEAVTEETILSVFYEVLRGDFWPDDMKTNWGDTSIRSCDWEGISCDSNGEIISISFPMLGESDGDRGSMQW